MVKIAMIKVAIRTNALSLHNHISKNKKTIKFITAPKLISFVIKLSEIESLRIFKIFEILIS